MLKKLVGIWVVLMILALPASAQFFGAVGGSSSSDESADKSTAIADAIKQATEAGVSVVVIDSNGTIVASGDKPAETPSEEQAAGDMENASDLMKVQSTVLDFRKTLNKRLEALPDSVAEVLYILRATSPDGRIMTFAETLLWTAVLLFVGVICEREIYGKRMVKNFVVARIQEAPQGYREKMPFLSFRFFMGILGAIFAMIVAYVIGGIIFGPTDDLAIQFTVAAIFATFAIIRLISGVWRMVLSPFLPQYRIPDFSNRDSKRLFHWLWILAALDVSALMFSIWVADFGLNYDVYALVYGGLSLVLSFGHISMVLVNRRAISGAIRNGRTPEELPWITRFVVALWAPLVMGYIAFAWLKLAYDLVLERPTDVPLIIGAYVVIVSILVVYGVINYVIERYFFRSREMQRLNEMAAEVEETEETEEDFDEGIETAPVRKRTFETFEQLARRVAGILAFVAGSIALIAIWDQNNIIFSHPLVDRGLDVIVILFIGYIIYHAFRIWIDSKIEEESGEEEAGELGDEGGANGASRLATLLPLFRNFILIVVVVTIALIALLEMGINVSPLFAGAGVVGLAVGFGAQTLVRDIFSGAFFLVDDAFRKGEYIDIGSVKGTVEKISVRSFQLRHHLGALNTIPFGEIQVLTNYSRDWVIMKLPLRVTYDTDVERVRKLIKKLGQELLSDPVIGDNFIQPLKSQGVIEMQDSAMIIRVKFMTKPGDQWLVRKKVYQEIRELFAREGIHFAHREVTVRLADGEKVDNLSPQQREAVAGAVQGAIDEDALEDINESDGP